MSNSKLIVAALKQTDPDLAQAIDAENAWFAAIDKRGARVKLYRQYAEGDHRANMTDQMRKMLRLQPDTASLNDFNDNYCGIVIDKMAGRVSVSEISTGEDTNDKNWLQPLLEKQDFQAAEGMWWRGAITDGDAFVMVDPQTLLWSSEPAYDGFSGMVAIYNTLSRKPVWACKVWSEGDAADQPEGDATGTGARKIMRLVVYQPAKITYWEGEEGASEVRTRKPEGTEGKAEQAWPAELDGDLPFVCFANERNNYTLYGNSEIRKAIPLQDVLNRTVYSMVMASEFSAFPVNWSKGLEIVPGGIVPGAVINLTLRDSSGKALTEFTQDQIAFLSASSVGQLATTNISQYTAQVEMIVREISQATQTPIYGITTQGAISGDALKQLEIGLIGKIQRFQRQNTDALRQLITLTAKMERVFQPGLSTPEVDHVDITWKSPELLDANAQITALITMRKDAEGLWADSFYQQKIGQLLGMSKDDIQAETDAAEKEKEEKMDELAKIQGSMIENKGEGEGGGEQPGEKQAANRQDMQRKSQQRALQSQSA